MLRGPPHLQGAISVRFPGVSLRFQDGVGRWSLIYRNPTTGRFALLKILKSQKGGYIAPSAWNTLGWLVMADGSAIRNHWEVQRYLDALDKEGEDAEAERDHHLSELTKFDLAPRLRHDLRKLMG